MENKTFTVKEAAQYLRVSRQFIYNLIKDKRIKAFSITKHKPIRYRITSAQIKKFIKAGEIYGKQ